MAAVKRIATVMLAAATAVGCAQQGQQQQPPPGNAFHVIYSTSVGIAAFRPGDEVGALMVDLHNVSTATVTITSVSLPGPGVGTVVRIEGIWMAPLPSGSGVNAVPASVYQTDPPVMLIGKSCHKQVLVPVSGFRMPPGAQARVYFILRDLRPGNYKIPNHIIYYSEDDVRYQQVMSWTVYGSVTRDAKRVPLYWAESACVQRTGTMVFKNV